KPLGRGDSPRDGGSVDACLGTMSALRPVDALGPAKMGKKLHSMRALRDTPQFSLARKRGATGAGSVVQISGTSGLRHAERGTLAEEARWATATAGTSRLDRVVIRGLAESLIDRF